MPGLGVGEIAVWLVTTGVVVGLPVAILVFVFRLGRRSASNPPEGRRPDA